MSTVDKAIQGPDKTLTSDQDQDLEDQRNDEASPSVKPFTVPEPRKKPWIHNIAKLSGKKRSVKEMKKILKNEKRK